MVKDSNSQQSVEIYNPNNISDTKLLVDLFNRNGLYQISNKYKMTVNDWLLTYRAKEMTSFYIVRENNRIIGCSGFFKYTIRGIAPENHIYSGFLLIDGGKRSGYAIANLYEEIGKKSAEMDRNVMITEILPSNRASLHLARMNGYIQTPDTWDDLFHFQSSFSYAITVLKSFTTTGDFDNWTGNEKIKISSQTINKNVVTSNFMMDSDELSVKTKIHCTHPFYLNAKNELKLSLITIGSRTYLKYDTYKLKCRKILAVTDRGISIKLHSKNGILKLPLSHNGEYKLKVGLKKGSLKAVFQNKPYKYEKFQLDVATDGLILLNMKYQNLCLKFNPYNGDVVYFEEDGYQLFIDTFGSAFLGSKVKFSYKEIDDQLIIKVKSTNVIIKKTIFFRDKIFVTLSVIKGNDVLCKNGIRINHQNYLYYDGLTDKYRRYLPGINPSESDDVVYQRWFKREPQEYYIYHGKRKLTVVSEIPASNQFELRPLMLFKLTSGTNLKYNYAIQSAPELDNHNEILWKTNESRKNISFVISDICSYGTQFETPVYLLENSGNEKTLNNKILTIGNDVVLESPTVENDFWTMNGILNKFIHPQIMLENGEIIDLKEYSGKLEFFGNVIIFDTFFNIYVSITALNSWITVYFLNNKFIWRIVGISKNCIKFSTNYEVIK